MLRAAASGDGQAAERLYEVLYGQLHHLAQRAMRAQPAAHTLQTTALVSEVYLRIAGNRKCDWENRRHFMAVAAKAMRDVLIDHARAKARLKRGGQETRVRLGDVDVPGADAPVSFLDLDEALQRLAGEAPDAARVVELRFFAGMTSEEAARQLELSPRTADRLWQFAKAYLHRELS